MTPAGTVVVVWRETPRGAEQASSCAGEHCTCVLRAQHVRVYYVDTHHVRVQEQLVASAHHTYTPTVQALHVARAHTYTPINKCRHYTIHPADA